MFIQSTEKKLSTEHNLMVAYVKAKNNKSNTLIIFFSDCKT